MLSEAEFEHQLRALCQAYGLQEFALYGRFAQTAGPNGKLLPAVRYANCESDDPVFLEEAAYYIERIKEPQEL